jgi:hypothetical protein
VHSGHAIATIDGALGRITPRSLQEELDAFAAAEATNRSNMTSHGESQSSLDLD